MQRSVVSMDVTKCMFLGSVDKVIAAGDAPRANVQILYSGEDSNELEVQESLPLHGRCTDFELCGVPRIAQTFGAVALWDSSNCKSRVSLLGMETFSSVAQLKDLNLNVYSDTCAISSLSYSADLELLAIGTEAGLVTIVDIHAGVALHTIKADPCGLLKVKFTRTGQLMTVGESTKAQIKIWDLRSSPAAQNKPEIALSQSLSEDRLHNAVKGKTTCICAHPVQEKLISGTSSGIVHLWDLRSEASIAFKPHAHTSVTDVLVHPRRLDTVLCGAADGTVRCFDHTLAPACDSDAMDEELAGGEDDQDAVFPVVCADSGPISSMDCENSSDTCVLLAGSAMGGVTRVVI